MCSVGVALGLSQPTGLAPAAPSMRSKQRPITSLSSSAERSVRKVSWVYEWPASSWPSRCRAFTASGKSSTERPLTHIVDGTSNSRKIFMKRQMPVRPPYSDHDTPSRSTTPGLRGDDMGE